MLKIISCCSPCFGNRFLHNVMINKYKPRVPHSSYHCQKAEKHPHIQINRALEEQDSLVTSRLAPGPGPWARAWPGHGSGVGAGWRSPHRLFLGAGCRVEVFGRAVGPGLAFFTFGSRSGGGGGTGCWAATWAWFMVCPVVITWRSSVPGGMNIIY